jgi:hypothetical protein
MTGQRAEIGAEYARYEGPRQVSVAAESPYSPVGCCLMRDAQAGPGPVPVATAFRASDCYKSFHGA